jgi:GNAT superfamily N-acetyltransferase
MRIFIESVTDSKALAAAAEICKRVFERELGVPCMRPVDPLRSFALLARLGAGKRPVGTLTVAETSSDCEQHARYGLAFPDSAKVARYTRLAVLPRYRGRGIPLLLMHEARRRFVRPQKVDYTWLLFDADKAAGSTLCTLLDFVPGHDVFATEWGLSRVMVKREQLDLASINLQRSYLDSAA